MIDVEYRGTYRYACANRMERALARAREALDPTGTGRAHVRFFVTNGTELVINATVAGRGAERRAVANALLVLASFAEVGAVETRPPQP